MLSLNTPESMEIYHNGMKSVSAMKQLIHLVACSCTAGEDDAQDQPTRVKRIVHYINEHLGSELKREYYSLTKESTENQPETISSRGTL